VLIRGKEAGLCPSSAQSEKKIHRKELSKLSKKKVDSTYPEKNQGRLTFSIVFKGWEEENLMFNRGKTERRFIEKRAKEEGDQWCVFSKKGKITTADLEGVTEKGKYMYDY